MKATETEKKDRAKEQAQAQLESIIELVKKLNSKNEKRSDQAREEIQEDALEAVIVKTYKILLCTGGPAVRIVGDLDEHNQPETATLQYQDWYTPWTDYETDSSAEDDSLLAYANQFYFVE